MEVIPSNPNEKIQLNNIHRGFWSSMMHAVENGETSIPECRHYLLSMLGDIRSQCANIPNFVLRDAFLDHTDLEFSDIRILDNIEKILAENPLLTTHSMRIPTTEILEADKTERLTYILETCRGGDVFLKCMKKINPDFGDIDKTPMHTTISEKHIDENVHDRVQIFTTKHTLNQSKNNDDFTGDDLDFVGLVSLTDGTDKFGDIALLSFEIRIMRSVSGSESREVVFKSIQGLNRKHPYSNADYDDEKCDYAKKILFEKMRTIYGSNVKARSSRYEADYGIIRIVEELVNLNVIGKDDNLRILSLNQNYFGSMYGRAIGKAGELGGMEVDRKSTYKETSSLTFANAYLRAMTSFLNMSKIYSIKHLAENDLQEIEALLLNTSLLEQNRYLIINNDFTEICKWIKGMPEMSYLEDFLKSFLEFQRGKQLSLLRSFRRAFGIASYHNSISYKQAGTIYPRVDNETRKLRGVCMFVGEEYFHQERGIDIGIEDFLNKVGTRSGLDIRPSWLTNKEVYDYTKEDQVLHKRFTQILGHDSGKTFFDNLNDLEEIDFIDKYQIPTSCYRWLKTIERYRYICTNRAREKILFNLWNNSNYQSNIYTTAERKISHMSINYSEGAFDLVNIERQINSPLMNETRNNRIGWNTNGVVSAEYIARTLKQMKCFQAFPGKGYVYQSDESGRVIAYANSNFYRIYGNKAMLKPLSQLFGENLANTNYLDLSAIANLFLSSYLCKECPLIRTARGSIGCGNQVEELNNAFEMFRNYLEYRNSVDMQQFLA